MTHIPIEAVPHLESAIYLSMLLIVLEKDYELIEKGPFKLKRPYVHLIEEAKKLAVEHYAFCYDIVDQCYGTFEKLADGLYKNIQWYFWWD